MFKIIKVLFFTYVILLAGYVSFQNLAKKRFGTQKVSYAKPSQICQDGGDDWQYCVYRGENSDPRSYLYVLHGKGENEEFWLKDSGYSALLQKQWQDKGGRIPTIITLSFGPLWLITPQGEKEKSGLMERFQSEVFSQIEGSLGPAKRRFIMGHSMGALNALSLVLEMPSSFSRVAILCPPIFNISPFSSWSEIASFLMRTGARLESLILILSVGREYFTNQTEYEAFSPLLRGNTAHFESSTQIYLTAGLRDGYGLFEATDQMVSSLTRAGARVQWRPQSGGHCSVDVVSLGAFFKL